MELGGTVTYPVAKDDNSAAVCLGVPRFAAGERHCRINPMKSHVAKTSTQTIEFTLGQAMKYYSIL